MTIEDYYNGVNDKAYCVGEKRVRRMKRMALTSVYEYDRIIMVSAYKKTDKRTARTFGSEQHIQRGRWFLISSTFNYHFVTVLLI